MKTSRYIPYSLFIFIMLVYLANIPNIYCQGISWQKTFQAGESCWGEKLFVNVDQNIDFFSSYLENNIRYMIQKRYSTVGDALESFTYELDELRIFHDVGIDTDKNVYILYEMDLFPYHNERLRKYNSNGALLWSVTLPWEYTYVCIDFDSDDNPFAAGYHRISEDQTEAFITKFDQSGNVLWTSTFTYGSWSKIWIHSISLDNNNNIFITGHTGWTVQDIFLAKFDPDGNAVWDKTLGTANDDEGWCVTNDQNNNVVVYGYINRQWVSYVNTGWIGKFNNDGDTIFVNTTYQGHEIGGPMYPTAIKTDVNNNIYIAGCHGCAGFVAKYNTDGTKLWEFKPSNWDASLEDIPVSIDVDLDENLYFIGDSSTQAEGKFFILGKVDPTISGIDGENMPDKGNKIFEFSLSQNFPNPFNPSTKLKYFVPSLNNIDISVYDALGNKIRTLVVGEKIRGYYSIEFNATGLSSGIYFCQMKSGKFIDTKKMLFLK